MSDQAKGVGDQKVIVEQATLDTTNQQEETRAAKEFSHQKDSDKSDMRVKVYSPFRDYYDGMAFSVSAANATGAFDILPKHHNFISLLSPCDLVVRTVKEADDRTIRISGGIMHVKADKIVVFLDV